MELSFRLPNKKEVLVKELLFKDLRNFSLYRDSTLTGAIKFLESFICTKNLNIVEKFLALLILREKCIGDKIGVNSKKGSVNIDLEYIQNNIGTFEDIREEITIDNIKCVLNYPSKFNIGDTDFVFSLIESVEIEGEKVLITGLSNEEYKTIINKLPKEIYNYLKQFINKNRVHFEVTALEERKKLDIKEIKLNVLNSSFPSFIIHIFNCITDIEYRELLFVLSKRMFDVNFLINSTYLEIQDFYKLYSDETTRENETLKSENTS